MNGSHECLENGQVFSLLVGGELAGRAVSAGSRDDHKKHQEPLGSATPSSLKNGPLVWDIGSRQTVSASCVCSSRLRYWV